MNWIDEIAAGKPEHLAIIDHDSARFTYGQLHEMIARMAAALQTHGVRPGDRVLLVGENCATFAVGMLAIACCQAWITPINARQTRAEVDAIQTHCDARCAVFTPEASDNSTAHGRAMGAASLGRLDCGEMLVSPIRDCLPEPIENLPDNRVAALMYTTGTTSAPKGVMLTHANLLWNAKTSSKIRGLTPEDEILAILPGTHIYCFSSGILAAFYAGASVRFVPRFTPQAVLDAFADGSSVMPAVPQMYQTIVNHLKSRGEVPNAPRLRLISSGGAPLDPDWKVGIEAFFGLPLHNGYGLTETSPGVSLTRPKNPRKDASVGEVVPDVEVVIDAPDKDGIGEVLIRGPNIMKGYYRDAQATATAIQPDGFFRSGDLGRFGAEGELYIVGRKKELIIRSGFNIYPPEIEAMLTRHPDILQAAVVGRQIKGNEEVLAFLLTTGDVSEGEVVQWLRARLVAYKIPQQIFIVDGFPVAPTGKILKHKLIDTFTDLLANL
ncbi:MAG: long-chain fatty acid--CoA ligase [Alphaproteobacteria bacterium]|nr:long-chain fatty acid--CoA ligase [Alphaproteobacteria bacterium]